MAASVAEPSELESSTLTPLPPHVTVSANRIIDLFDRHGANEYIGEPMTILSHSIQSACIAADAGEDDEAQLACLVHDVGHLLGLEAGGAPPPPGMDGCGTLDHEGIGATFLAELGFSETIAFVCKNHVAAKRYLCAVDPEYINGLTEASATTLAHQGGPMSEPECREFETHPAFDLALRMRKYDEGAKDPTRPQPDSAAEWKEALLHSLEAAHVSGEGHTNTFGARSEYADAYVLSPEQKRQWAQDGFLVVKDPFSAAGWTPEELSRITDEAAALPTNCYPEKPWLIHKERTRDGEVRITRVENFCNSHPEWSKICREGVVAAIVSQAFGVHSGAEAGERAVLFKDKINFKPPGGAGFLCHQDATAFATDTTTMASYHITAMIAIDSSTVEKGCLQVAAGQQGRGVLPNTAGVTNKAVEEEMTFHNVTANAGDLVIFDSFIPHRSGFNNTEESRRSVFLTYNMESDGGDCHSKYYAAKAAVVKAGDISINKDFAGTIVE